MNKYLQLIFCFTFISCGSGDDESLTPDCPFTVEIIGLDADVCVGQSGRILLEISIDSLITDSSYSFYYNEILIPSSDIVRLDSIQWSVAIINPLTMANFSSVNEDGCTWTVELMNADYCS